jgi:hypothetical protein
MNLQGTNNSSVPCTRFVDSKEEKMTTATAGCTNGRTVMNGGAGSGKEWVHCNICKVINSFVRNLIEYQRISIKIKSPNNCFGPESSVGNETTSPIE